MIGFSKLNKKELDKLRKEERRIFDKKEYNEQNPHPSEMRYWI